jgi:hypothetical protein
MTVYVVHEAVFNGVPVHDTTPAEEFGERRVLVRTKGNSNVLVYDDEGFLVDEKTKNIDANFEHAAVEAINRGLVNFTRDDYLLPIGAPRLIAAAGAMAARNARGFLRILVWNERKLRYAPVVQRLWEERGSAGHGRKYKDRAA